MNRLFFVAFNFLLCCTVLIVASTNELDFQNVPSAERSAAFAVDSSRFFVVTAKMSWDQANAECTKRGSRLAIIKSAQDQQEAVKLLTGRSYWFGLSIIPRKAGGIWTWVDGSQLKGGDYVNWNPGEPNSNSGTAFCAHFLSSYNYRWDDVPCDFAETVGFVCERFCESTYPSDFNIDISPHFIDARGHQPIEIKTSLSCLNASKTFLCTFYDPLKKATIVSGSIGKETSPDSSIICNAPFIYGAGRMRVTLTIIEKFPIDFGTNFTFANLSSYEEQLDALLDNFNGSVPGIVQSSTIVTVGLDENQVKVSLKRWDNETLLYQLDWDADWFTQQFPASDSDFLIPGHVDIAMLWYNQTAKEWQFYDVWPEVSNSGLENVTVQLAGMDLEVATSVFTFKVTTALNWTEIAEIFPAQLLEDSRQHQQRQTRGDKYDFVMELLKSTNEVCKYKYILIIFPPALAVAKKVCTAVSAAKIAGQLLPALNAELGAEECAKWLRQQPPITPVVCPPIRTQVESDSRYEQYQPHSLGELPPLPSLDNVDIPMPPPPPIIFYSDVATKSYYRSATEDNYDRCVVAEYDLKTGKSLTSYQVFTGEWMPVVNAISELSDVFTDRMNRDYLSKGWEFAKYVYEKKRDANLMEYFCCGHRDTWLNIEMCDRYQTAIYKWPCEGDLPGTGTGSGDPHFTTLDGFYYTFNGAGEFWLIKSAANDERRQFSVQARTQPRNGNVAGFCGFAMQAFANSSIIQLTLRGNSVIDVFVDGTLLFFDHPLLQTQYFRGAIVTSMAKDSSKVAVSLSSDIAFRFTAASGFMNVFITVGEYHRGKVIGLMGNFDRDVANDMTSPDGIILPPDAGDRRIHYEFGMLWNITKDESLFFYNEKQSYEDFWKPNYVPNFARPEPTPQAVAVCGTSQACLYDYEVTKDTSVAADTKKFEDGSIETVGILNERVPMCPSLVRPLNSYMALSDGFFVNSTARFSCYEGFWLQGSANLTCQDNETWDFPVPECRSLYCERVESPEYGQLSAPNGTIIGSVVSFSCGIGYDLIGSQQIICLSSGVWDQPAPICQVKVCPPVEYPVNGSYLASDTFNYGSKLQFTCFEGFHLVAAAADVECQADGTWSDDITVSCDRTTCVSVTAPEFGETVAMSDGLFYNSSVEFVCGPAFVLEGESTAHCTVNGTWSSPTPTCRPKKCQDFSYLPEPFVSNSTTVYASPNSVPITGHWIITLSGLCFNLSNEHICSFYDLAKGKVSTKANFFTSKNGEPYLECVVPYLYAIGRIRMEVIVQDLQSGAKSAFHTMLTVIEGTPTVQADLVNDKTTSTRNTVSYRLSWENPKEIKLAAILVVFNHTSDSWTHFDQLGTADGTSTELVVEMDITKIPTELLTGFFMFKLAEARSAPSAVSPADFSKVMFFELSDDVAESACSEWIDTNEAFVAPSSSDCPPELYKAKLDARFVRIGELTYQAVTLTNDGSLSAVVTYNESDGLISASHFTKDVPWAIAMSWSGDMQPSYYDSFEDQLVPQNLCCRKGDNNLLCQSFLEKRPVNFSCSNYIPPGRGVGYGDPHFTTFDGLSFTLNFNGDFIVLRLVDNSFELQGQMEFLYENDTAASVFTGFAIKMALENKEKPTILRFKTSSAGLVAFVGAERLYPQPSPIYFPGAVISLNETEASIAFFNDVAIRFSLGASNALLNYEIQLGQTHRGNVTGLMGNFDGVAENDFTSSVGTIIPIDSPANIIMTDFGLSWLVTTDDLLSFDSNKRNVKIIKTPPAVYRLDEAQEVCGYSQTCIYDYQVTGDRGLAQNTQQFEEFHMNATYLLNIPTVMCPNLQRPENGYFVLSNFNYVGSWASFGCFVDYWLNGTVSTECLADGSWVSTTHPECLPLYCNASLIDEALNEPTLAVTTTNGSLIGSLATFSCQDGFLLDGLPVVACSHDATWNSTAPSCVKTYTDTDDSSIKQNNDLVIAVAVTCGVMLVLLIASLIVVDRRQRYSKRQVEAPVKQVTQTQEEPELGGEELSTAL